MNNEKRPRGRPRQERTMEFIKVYVTPDQRAHLELVAREISANTGSRDSVAGAVRFLVEEDKRRRTGKTVKE